MKRYISTALVLALIGAFPFAPATAEAPEVICEAVESPTPEAGDPGDTGLTFEGVEQVPAETPEAPASQAPTPDQEEAPAQTVAVPSPYARVPQDGATLYADTDGMQALGTVAGGGVVLALGGEVRTKVALYAQGGVIVGYMDAGALAPLTEEDHAAYMDAAASGGAVALYEDDLNLPLIPVAFTEATPAEEAPAAEGSLPEEAASPTGETEGVPAPVEEAPAAEGSLPEGAGSPTGETEGVAPAEETPAAEGSLPEGAGSPTGETEGVPAPVEETPATEGSLPEEAVSPTGETEGVPAPVEETPAAEGSLPEGAASPTGETEGVPAPVEEAPATEGSLPEGAASPTGETEGVAPAEEAPAAEGSLPEGAASPTGETEGVPAPVEEAPAVQPEPAPAEAIPAAQPAEPQPEADAAVMAPAEQAEPIPEAPAEQAPAAVEAPAPVATGIRLSAESLTIGHKEVFTGLTAIAVPEGSVLPAVSWRSDNTKYVKVDAATGAITGAKRGSAIVYAAIADGVEAACLVTVDKGPKKVAVNPSKLTLGSGGMTAQLTWSLPSGGTAHYVTYSSNKPSVVTVDANGLVTSVNPGSATVTVKAPNGKSAKCKVKVVAAPASVVFPQAILSVATGQRLAIGAKALGSNGKAVESTITYAIDPGSADSGCIALDPATGELVAVRKGQAIITATAYNGVFASCPVTVAVGPATIKLSEDALTLGVKEIHPSLLAELTPPAGEAECASVIAWSVDNKKIARVDEATGAITGLRKGSCTVTATAANGLTATCRVTVVKAPGKLSLEPANGTLEVGQTGQYKVKYSKNAGGGVTFATSDPSIATIDDDGVVTAVSPGTVAIAVQSYNGKKAAAKLVVTKAAVVLPTDDDANVDSTTDSYDEGMSNAQKLEYVIYVAQTQKGKPYKYGGGYSRDSNPSGFDCSGLVYWSFLHIGIKVEASAYRQGYDDSLPKITNAAELKRGDIVCFNTNENDSDESDHTGIYLGNGKFIHASSSAKKVVESTLASGYYSRTFSWGRRVLP